jgi:hypothetical protein
MSFDWNASYEWLAEKFYRETGMMAPGKADPFGSGEADRGKAWNEWLTTISEQAWREWHERHGMLRDAAKENDHD